MGKLDLKNQDFWRVVKDFMILKNINILKK